MICILVLVITFEFWFLWCGFWHNGIIVSTSSFDQWLPNALYRLQMRFNFNLCQPDKEFDHNGVIHPHLMLHLQGPEFHTQCPKGVSPDTDHAYCQQRSIADRRHALSHSLKRGTDFVSKQHCWSSLVEWRTADASHMCIKSTGISTFGGWLVEAAWEDGILNSA